MRQTACKLQNGSGVRNPKAQLWKDEGKNLRNNLPPSPPLLCEQKRGNVQHGGTWQTGDAYLRESVCAATLLVPPYATVKCPTACKRWRLSADLCRFGLTYK